MASKQLYRVHRSYSKWRVRDANVRVTKINESDTKVKNGVVVAHCERLWYEEWVCLYADSEDKAREEGLRIIENAVWYCECLYV